jgi:hypothetical protein
MHLPIDVARAYTRGKGNDWCWVGYRYHERKNLTFLHPLQSVRLTDPQACAQLAGIVGPQVYQSRFGPQYRVSYSVSIAMLAGAVAMMALSWFCVARRDRREKNEASSASQVP